MTREHMSTRREIFCANAFNRYLSCQPACALPYWTHVLKGQDPPDFFLSFDNKRYAVEVTSTEIFREPSIGESHVIEETYEDTHRKIVNSVNDIARTQGLDGSYVITFHQPIASTDFQRVRKHLVKELLDLISRSKTEAISWPEMVRYRDRELCELFKLGEGEIRIFDAFSYDFVQTDSDEHRTFVTEILRQAVKNKKELIEKKGIIEPAILLLLNTYGLADSETYKSCIEKIQERDMFCAIFVIQPNGSGCMVHSNEPAWLYGSGVNALPDTA